MNTKKILLSQLTVWWLRQLQTFFKQYVLINMFFGTKRWVQNFYFGSISRKSVSAGEPFNLGRQRLLLPLGLFDLMYVLSLFWVNLESSPNLNFHMGTCFFWMMCSANTFFPHSIHFKTLIKEIPEEHQTCLAYCCLRLQNFGSSNLQLSSNDRKQDSAVWARCLSIWPCREALH